MFDIRQGKCDHLLETWLLDIHNHTTRARKHGSMFAWVQQQQWSSACGRQQYSSTVVPQHCRLVYTMDGKFSEGRSFHCSSRCSSSSSSSAITNAASQGQQAWRTSGQDYNQHAAGRIFAR
ncbi:unnamed protein product, partial [Ectocarpus sp. 8 AP-2014]